MDLSALKDKLLDRVPKTEDGPGCFLCKWILEDIAKNGKLTGYPKDYGGQSIFPDSGKEKHLALEGFTDPTPAP